VILAGRGSAREKGTAAKPEAESDEEKGWVCEFVSRLQAA